MEKLLKEINRRGVFRVAAAYAVVAWIVIQVVVAVFPPLGLPAWTVTGTIVLSALGFPIAIVIAWVYEWTPAGIKTQEEADASGVVTSHAIGRQIDFVIIALLVVAVGWLIWQLEKPAPIADKSIAVLPFASFSQAADDEDFADGLTEELLNVLAKVPDLKVAGRTSSFYYKGKNPDLREAGRQLGVAFVLEGSVRRSESTLRVTTQLIQVEDGFHLWSETYDRPAADIFAVQDDIAKRVADVMQIKLLGEDLERVLAKGTSNPEALGLFMIAQSKARTRTVPNLRQAVGLLEQATKLDPGYADAWASLARTRYLAAGHAGEDAQEAYIRAVGEVERALSLDPNSSMAWAAKATILGEGGGFNPGHPSEEQTLAAFEKALELDPNNVDAMHHFGIYHMRHRQAEESLAIYDRALALDPLFARLRNLKGIVLNQLGRAEEARRLWLETIELFPESQNGWLALATQETEIGHFHHAAFLLEQGFEFAMLHQGNYLELSGLYSDLGMKEEARESIARLLHLPFFRGEWGEAFTALATEDYETLRVSVTDPEPLLEYPPSVIGRLLEGLLVAGGSDVPEQYVLGIEGLATLSDYTADRVRADNLALSLYAGSVLQRKGADEEARVLFEAVLIQLESQDLPGDPRHRLAMRSQALAALGRTEEALKTLGQLDKLGFIGFGRSGSGADFLDLSYFQPLHDDSRYEEIRHRFDERVRVLRDALKAGTLMEEIMGESLEFEGVD